MKKKSFWKISFALIGIMAMLLCTCGGDDNGGGGGSGSSNDQTDVASELIGFWKSSETPAPYWTVDFTSNSVTWGGLAGSSVPNFEGTIWTAKNGEIKWKYNGAETLAFTYSISGNTLTIVTQPGNAPTYTLTKSGSTGGNEGGNEDDVCADCGNKPCTCTIVTNTIKQVSAGGYFSLVIKTDSSLWACGSNDRGQLGDGTTTDRLTPTRIETETWVSVSAGYRYTMAIKAGGTLWAWGRNDSGRLGDGTSGYVIKSTPTRIGSDANWTSVSAGFMHTMAIKTDETLWAWGSNSMGELGDGTGGDYGNIKSTPTQIFIDE